MTKGETKDYFLVFLKTAFLWMLCHGINYIHNQNLITEIQRQYFTDSELERMEFITAKNENDKDSYPLLFFYNKQLYYPFVENLLKDENRACLFVHIHEYQLLCSYRKSLTSEDMSYGYYADCSLDLLEELVSCYENNSRKYLFGKRKILKIDLAKARIEHPEIFAKFKK